MERIKSLLLALLVALSLVQSYFLMYGLPRPGVESKPEEDYLSADELGPEMSAEELVFPERMILHMGGERHTVFYPDHLFYELIYEKLKGRVFRGFQRNHAASVDWHMVRNEEPGVELRFARAVPFELLRRVFQLEGDFLFSRDLIDRIWIYTSDGREDVRAFLFSSDGANVYEVLRADMTAGDVRQFVGFGEYWVPYTMVDDDLYIPQESLTYPTWTVPYGKYTSEQMQRNLFFDPGITRMTQNSEDGSQIFTDGKRGLKIEQDGAWLVYTDPIAVSGEAADPVEPILSAVEFVNRHGGWNGPHLLAPGGERQDGEVVRFQQYFQGLPVLPGRPDMRFGYMQLIMQQGEVAQYERPLIVMETAADAPAEGELSPGADVPGENGAVGPAADGTVSGAGEGESKAEDEGGAPVAETDGAGAADAGNGGGAFGESRNSGHAAGTDGGSGNAGNAGAGNAKAGKANGGNANAGNENPGDTNAGPADGRTGAGGKAAERGPSRSLPAGETLMRLIRQKANGARVEALLPVYRAVVREDRIWLTPAWAIRLADGEWRLLE